MQKLKGGGGSSVKNYLFISAASLLILALAGCGEAPGPYYAARPPFVVVTQPQQPTTQYVYGTINSTNTTHITSESTVHIITNHPTDAVPPPAIQTPVENQQVAEPPPPEEQQPREEPAAESQEPAAQPPPEEPPPAPEPPPESNSSGSSGSD